MKYTMEDLAFIKNGRAQQHKSSEPVTCKVCVVTGATSGVGLEAVKQLAQGGAKLVLVGRNREKLEQLKAQLERDYAATPDTVIADFSRLSDVRHAAKEINSRYDTIDILINSVGIHSTKRLLSEDGNELVFQVNHLAPFLFTMLLLDRVKKSAQGRIIQVNSEGHRFGGLKMSDLDWSKRFYIGLRSYGASKTAQLMTVMTLAERLKDTSVTINAMHPGGVRTNIGSNNGWLYRAWLHGVIWHFLKDTAISGESLYYLAAAPELKTTSGKYFNLTIDEKPMPHALDETVQEQIWVKSHELTGLAL
ncbi:MAG: short-chain dehydrogenase [Clostridiales bacterium]|nr:short-chain dehydrogenase [Clostridiales bacterium]